MSSRRCIEVPAEVRRKAAAQGAPGRRWLDGLGAVVADLERAWDVVVGATLQGGSDAYVAEATAGDGRRAILKVALPGDDASHEIEALRHADGRGYVRLLRHDLELRAMLQERLGASLAESGLPVRAQLEVICSALRRAWDVPPEPSFLSGADKAAWLEAFIAETWHELGRPCAELVVECALSFAEARRRAFDPARAVLVHGDAHSSNALMALDGYKLVDPDGLFAEPACDLAVPMREHSRELLDAADTLRAARERCEYLSRLTAVEPRAIWEWGFMERVSTGLLALRVGREELGREMLAVADELVTPWTYDVTSRPGWQSGEAGPP
ncbi:MAG TPA: aminoglycoside phosphotransferase family protein [Solirubrobacteraceae bacterium]|nr:aminoglycoside phosphotransferase family protein [Solirubrobacteraceae bacterium]